MGDDRGVVFGLNEKGINDPPRVVSSSPELRDSNSLGNEEKTSHMESETVQIRSLVRQWREQA